MRPLLHRTRQDVCDDHSAPPWLSDYLAVIGRESRQLALSEQSSGRELRAHQHPQLQNLPRLPSAGREQERHRRFLDRETARIDALVAKVRDAIDRLKELRTALISAAVTGKIDVREEVA